MVKVFSTPTCPWCKKVKDYLKSNNVEFQDINVAEDVAARKEMFQISNQMGVPVVQIDHKVILGFDKDAIDETLGL
ncbi:glutaredoxin domain-containing protein [Haloimpatiens lingqiaonensis]|uniref:glutaredoxin domain-containing protein n=1 Tax=Haloimpatiens lingqiaonensis TaxID=1380675 RepID=UPI0010FEAD05|nr:glutaredoxin domain-containing protein [Haloimpatiens lingqiaonensis]